MMQFSEPSAQSEAEQPVSENVVEVTDGSTVDAAVASTDVESASADPVLDDAPEAVADTGAADKSDETVTVVVQSTIETFTETVTVSDTSTGTTDATLTVETTEEVVDAPETVIENVVVEEVMVENAENSVSDQAPEPEPVDGSATTAGETSLAEPVSEEAVPLTQDASEGQVEAVDAVAAESDQVAAVEVVAVESSPVGQVAEAIVEAALDQATESTVEMTEPPAVDQPAYEEYLKDSNDPIHIYQTETGDPALETDNSQASQQPVAKINSQGELQIEMDTKNAHVWNELGNVYFNTGAFDDAVIAYSKAIELDRWFAWPYSNLALTYVQKGRFVEAILLYQRSIELFKSDKDKAVSWNRLGNVYRRINDYENAIASYQRADELDPDNTTLSLQSRFSLLGNYVMEQKATYVS